MKKFTLFSRQPLYWFMMVIFFLTGLIGSLTAQQGRIVITDSNQKDFLNAYKLLFNLSDRHYRGTSSSMDTKLFPKFGEFSVYWAMTGSEQGNFIIPDSTLPSGYTHINSKPYSISTGYNWQAVDHRSIQFEDTPKKIAIFRSKIESEGHSISWEYQYFKNMFETFLFKDLYYCINEDGLSNGLSDSTEILIIPAFTVHPEGDKQYIDSIFTIYSGIKSKLASFLSRGGTIYTEGNAVYFLQKAELLGANAVDFNDKASATSDFVELNSFSASNPIAFTHIAVANKLYCGSIPKVNTGSAEIIAKLKSDNRPVIFALSGGPANGGRIICNLGLPTVGGISDVESGSRQLQWTFNTLLYAFSTQIDVTRSVFNQLPPVVTGGDNAISFDRIDTFEVRVLVRNLSGSAISGIILKENLRNYFKFIDVTSGVTNSFSNGILTLSNISVPAHGEIKITYRICTTDPDDAVHEQIDKLLDYGNFIAASINTTSYSNSEGAHFFSKRRNYADIMFSARLFGDADVNWKNFLNLEYQPFKVFMIMENKERTAAENTVYTQFIPKDVPFYWSDKSIDIPVLKTPGGKFVDVLKGSNKESSPEYDMDSDGDPDVWLDTASIFPKGYTLTEDSVYWANPWNHLRGDNQVKYEDIDHDGNITMDTNGDGIVDIQDTGDKIRVWKVTWNIGTVNGYDYFDPYCSYEIWIDPPDLVKLAAGIGYVHNMIRKLGTDSMFFPYTPYTAIDGLVGSNNKSGKHWMEWDSTHNDYVWKQYILQKMHNYEGFTFIDTTGGNYKLKFYDECLGTTPQPHQEFLAVVSMGGEEIDMYHPTPSQSQYSKIEYKTIFNEQRTTPIRTTYTYWAPLPNPLQFEYLASNFTAFDTLGNRLEYLPAKGKARLKFDLDASTEYTYYWIRNVGHEVMYNDPSEKIDGIEPLGDGVFGYMIYEIPKGMGGYKITLPKKADGSYNTDSIVKVDGKPFTKWLDNPNTANEVQIWEDPYSYLVYIPQLLIPPALDDDNKDGKDDWIDDRGDRFSSTTGFLHDAFMPGIGEDYYSSPATPFMDEGYGMVNHGWNIGTDNTYGDDYFENLGKTHFTINALYEGKGKEGPVDISKGGTLVVEEIFGGSPWVIFSHVLSGFAQGVDYKITSSASPASVKYGTDTICIKHVIEDINEPREFNENFDPYHITFGYGESSVTSLAGGKDPCSLIDPAISTSVLIDPGTDHKNITLIPSADHSNPDLAGYPRAVSGTFLEVKIEVMNGTDDNWYDICVKPVLSGLGITKVEMSYVAYPRPLVPAHVVDGGVVPGDQPGTFTTGWRFNQPDGEVLVKMGDTLNMMQPTRRGYFIFLFKIDESLEKGIYDIAFTLSGKHRNYKSSASGNLNFDVPSVKFSIVDKTSGGKVTEYQKIRIGSGPLHELKVNGSEYFQGLQQVKWSGQDVNFTDFDNITGTLPATFSDSVEIIDLSKVSHLPNADTAKLYLLEKAVVNSYRAGEDIELTTSENMYYTYANLGKLVVPGNKIIVSPYGPKILIKQELYSVNGVPVENGITIDPDNNQLYIVTKLSVINVGSDVSQNTVISVHPGLFYNVLKDSLASNLTYEYGLIFANMGLLVPGENKSAYIFYGFNQAITSQEDLMTVIKLSDIEYGSTNIAQTEKFRYRDTTKVLFETFDFQLEDIQSQKIGDREYSITAKAVNRGLPGSNVWLRIYPVVGGGISELPIAELRIANFKPGETVELPVNYTLPNNERIELFAKIDDGDKIPELIEKNNSKIVLLTEALKMEDFKLITKVTISPNPFSDWVKFAYELPSGIKEVSISIFTQTGTELVKFVHCPNNIGLNSIDWSPSNLVSGKYIYKITIKGLDGKQTEVPGILVKTEQ